MAAAPPPACSAATAAAPPTACSAAMAAPPPLACSAAMAAPPPPACSAAMAARTPPACSAMAAPRPPAPTRSSPFPSHTSSAMPDLAGGEDTDVGTKKVTGENGEVAEHLDGGEIHKHKSCPRKREQKQEYQAQVGDKELRGEKSNQKIVRNEPARSQNIKRGKNKLQVGEVELHGEKAARSKSIKSGKNKGGLPVGSISLSPRVTTSPGANILVRAAALKRSMTERPCSSKRAKIDSSSQQSFDSPRQLPAMSPSLQDLSPIATTTNSHGSRRGPRKLVSEIWKEVEPIYQGRLLVQGRCIHCQQVFPASRDSGSSHIGRHLKVCPAKTAMSEMVDKMGRPKGVDPDWKYNPELAKRKLVKFIVVNEMPFTMVEYKPFREFTAALNPFFENVSRTTIKNECEIAFREQEGELQQYFGTLDSRVSLTGDMWTSNQKLGYFCLTCHVITSEWKLSKRIIRFVMMETPHNAWNMFNVVLSSLQEWNLEDKLCGFTLDNAAVNTSMVNHLRDNLNEKYFLLVKGRLLHFRCATHVFNIIVQDGLKEIKSVVNNIRESVKYVRSSQSRMEKFVAVLMQVGLTSASKAPAVDVTTRWNSTYLMLETSIPLRSAFNSLDKQDKDYEFAPSSDEWTLAEAVCKVLRVFYTATVTLSGSKYPTCHLYFCELWKIKKMLNTEESNLEKKITKKEASDTDMIIARMVHQMQLKFDQYWRESYMSACIPVILDPRFKYDLLEYLLRDFGTENEAHTWMNDVKKTMKTLFDEYSEEVSLHSQERDSPSAEEVDDDNDPLAAWDQYMRSKRSKMNNELECYLKEPLVPRKKKVKILQWWKVNSSTYPVLSTMARDILATSASTVPSESAFSTGGRVVSDYRSRLSPSTVEMLICLQDWFKAADALDHDE